MLNEEKTIAYALAYPKIEKRTCWQYWRRKTSQGEAPLSMKQKNASMKSTWKSWSTANSFMIQKYIRASKS